MRYRIYLEVPPVLTIEPSEIDIHIYESLQKPIEYEIDTKTLCVYKNGKVLTDHDWKIANKIRSLYAGI